MGKIIAVVSQKGGVGKSTLARALSVAFAQAGWQTEIADMDIDQGTVTAWQQRRLKANSEPAITVRQFGNVGQALTKAQDCDMLIFDGAPHASKATAAMAKAADLVIIPVGLSLDDLQPAVVLANALVDREGIPVEKIVFVLSLTGTSAVEIQDSREYLLKTRFTVIRNDIPKKPAFSRAHDFGLSLIESQYKAPRKQATQVISEILEKFQELTSA